MSESKHSYDMDSPPLIADQTEGQDVDDLIKEKVQTMTWALVDDHINAEDRKELEQLLEADPEARSTYIECVQMHADLQEFFAEPSPQADVNPSATPAVPSLDLPTIPGGSSTPAGS